MSNEKTKERTFLKIYSDVMGIENIDGDSKIILSKIIELNSLKDGCYISNSGLSRFVSNLTRGSIITRIRKLKDLGYITSEMIFNGNVIVGRILTPTNSWINSSMSKGSSHRTGRGSHETSRGSYNSGKGSHRTDRGVATELALIENTLIENREENRIDRKIDNSRTSILDRDDISSIQIGSAGYISGAVAPIVYENPEIERRNAILSRKYAIKQELENKYKVHPKTFRYLDAGNLQLFQNILRDKYDLVKELALEYQNLKM